jgi:hypothetical protein
MEAQVNKSDSGGAERRYSNSIDYLLASIVYLGTNDYWWARTPKTMADELQLDQYELENVFRAFPGLFRKSVRVSKDNKQNHYSLQARYAKREGPDFSEPDETTMIEPLKPDKLQLLIDFVLKMAEQEAKEADQKLTRLEQAQSRSASLRANFVAVGAAVIAAIAAIASTWLAHVWHTKC